MSIWTGLEIQCLGSQHRAKLLAAPTRERPCSTAVSLWKLLLRGGDSSHEFPWEGWALPTPLRCSLCRQGRGLRSCPFAVGSGLFSPFLWGPQGFLRHRRVSLALKFLLLRNQASWLRCQYRPFVLCVQCRWREKWAGNTHRAAAWGWGGGQECEQTRSS